MTGANAGGTVTRWLLPALLGAMIGGFSCGGEREAPPGAVHDTGRELIGEPTAVIATVDGTPITLAEVNLLSAFWMDSRAPELQRTQTRVELQRRALDKLIEQVVLVQEAARMGYEVADSVVEARVQEWEQRAANAQEVQSRLERSHIGRETIGEHLRRDALIQQMVRETIQDTLSITPEEARAYYEGHPEFFDNFQVRASHILVATDPGAPPESLDAARARITDLLDRVRAGEDFAALARAHSTCPSAPQGGDLGFARRGQWVPPFEEAAFALAPGEVSDVVQTTYGFHIIKVTAVDDTSWTPFPEVSQAIEQYLRTQRTQETVDSLAARLRSQKEVVINITTDP